MRYFRCLDVRRIVRMHVDNDGDGDDDYVDTLCDDTVAQHSKIVPCAHSIAAAAAAAEQKRSAQL